MYTKGATEKQPASEAYSNADSYSCISLTAEQPYKEQEELKGRKGVRHPSQVSGKSTQGCIQLLCSTHRTVRESCAFVLLETWLNSSVPDSAIELEWLACFIADRALVEGGTTSGKGFHVYVNVAWCANAVGNTVSKHSSLLLEVTILKCRPFSLLREFMAILLVAVYITCNSKINKKSKALSKPSYSSVRSRHPTQKLSLSWLGISIILTQTQFSKLHQHINFPTQRNNTHDDVYASHPKEPTRSFSFPTLVPLTIFLSC